MLSARLIEKKSYLFDAKFTPQYPEPLHKVVLVMQAGGVLRNNEILV